MPSTADPLLRALRAPALALVLIGLVACAEDDTDEDPPAAPVVVSEVRLQSLDRYKTFPGRTRGTREVEVRARVEGILQQRSHTEGAQVAQGEVLFRIDPEPFEIALQRANAQRANAQAGVDEARREWERVRGLYERDAISTRERDRARSALELARAELAMAEAERADARRQLRYTEVTAPVDGITGLERVPEGSLLEPGALLTVITQLDPLHLRFGIPERDPLARRIRSAAEGALEVELLLGDGEIYAHPGEIDFAEAGVDPATGTVTARAVFPNPDAALRPGRFLRVRVLQERLEEVFLVPEQAIGEGADGPQVFVVVDGEARATPVTLGPVIDGQQVLHDGLKEGDRVIVEGLAGLSDGAAVRLPDEDGDGEG